MAEDASVADGPRFGRRQGRGADADAGADADGKTDAPAAGRRRAADGSEVAGGRAAQAATGWAESATPAGAWGRGDGKEADDADGPAAGRRGRGRMEEETEVVAIIRDVDEENLDDYAMKVADAPRNAIGRKVQTLQELANSAALDVSASRQAGIDLALLTSQLCPPESLAEPDEPWDFDRVLQEVSQAMTAEAEKREAEEGGSAAAAAVGAATATSSTRATSTRVF